jgi:hypothetical protein
MTPMATTLITLRRFYKLIPEKILPILPVLRDAMSFTMRHFAIIALISGISFAIAYGYIGTEYGINKLFVVDPEVAPLVRHQYNFFHAIVEFCVINWPLLFALLYIDTALFLISFSFDPNTTTTANIQTYLISTFIVAYNALMFAHIIIIHDTGVVRFIIVCILSTILFIFSFAFVYGLLWAPSIFTSERRLRIFGPRYRALVGLLLSYGFLTVSLVLFSPAVAAIYVFPAVIILLAIAYVVFALMLGPLKYLAMLLVLLVVMVSGSWQPFKYHFPGISKSSGASYYDEPIPFPPKEGAPPSKESPRGIVPPGIALRKWLDRNRMPRPKLVIVATSGGGYRAAFWSALVLDKLLNESGHSGQLPGLAYNIRLLTGASGGMIGAAYFASRISGPNENQRSSIADQIQWDVRNSAPNRFLPSVNDYRHAAVDSLSAVAMQLIQNDIFHIVSPWTHTMDRGRVLEDQWTTLDFSFERFNDGVLDGSRPSIIFSPVIVDSGAPLFISNLDLSETKLVEKGHGVEFFGLFPEAPPYFAIKTAARMSASFPYVSPAVDLPVTQKARVTDAGFADNYGVRHAVDFLMSPHIKGWIENNLSGVILIQIRAFPDKDNDGGEAEGLSRSGAFEWLTSPFETLLTARKESQVSANNKLFEMAQTIYRAHSVPSRLEPAMDNEFLSTVIFQPNSTASLSWYLSRDDLEQLKKELEDGENLKQFEKLKRLYAAR